MGLVNCPWAVCDEPGAWEINGGALLWSAIRTAQGKPGSPLRILLIGTLAPFASRAGHWYYDVIDKGSHGSTYVQSLRADPELYDSWREVRRCNPLKVAFADTRRKLRKTGASSTRQSFRVST